MTYGYEYNFDNGMISGQELMLGMGSVIAAVLVILMLVALAFGIVSYVLGSVGLYRIAKRRGIHHAWLAWLPVGSSWLLGSISDHYQYVVKHKTTKRRRVLLILSAVLTVVSFLFAIATLVSNITGSIIAQGVSTSSHVAMGIVLMVLYYWIVFGLSIAATVVSYIAYYDLFRSCKPNNAVLFLVLSVIFNVTLPFFTFACGNSDQGMPERRAPRPQVQQTYEPEAAEEEIPVVEAEPVEEPEEE